MACFHPLQAYRDTTGLIVFTSLNVVEKLQLPCGQCIGCRLQRSYMWAIRCLHEKSQHQENCFITLTYDDDHLPKHGSLEIKHFQDFMKRLRRNNPGKLIRYFHCGEYGEKLSRPHYHACLFGHDFNDKELIRKQGDKKYYTSETLKRIWTHGLVDITDLNYETAAYAARYIMKKINGDRAIEHYNDFDPETGELKSYKKPEYITMSRRPGIGTDWFIQYVKDVFPSDEIIIKGKRVAVPKFYDKKFELLDPESYECIKKQRKLNAEKHKADNTPARLAVKEKCKLAQIKQLKRNKI